MQEELKQRDRNNVWEHILKVSANQVIGTQWIFHNKFHEDGNILRNLLRFVAKRYNH